MLETSLDFIVYYSQLSLFGLFLSSIAVAVILSIKNKIKLK